MPFFLTLFGPFLIFLAYLSSWWQYDQNGILLICLFLAWGGTFLVGSKIFSRTSIMNWVIVPIVCFLLVVNQSGDIITENIAKHGLPTEISDDLYYLHSGQEFADCIRSGHIAAALTLPSMNQPGYIYALGLLFLVLGNVSSDVLVLAAVSINAMLLAMSAMLLMKYAAARKLNNRIAFNLGLLFVTYLPVFGLSTVVRKDVFVAFFLIGAYLLYTRFHVDSRMRTAIWLAVSIFLLSLFRLPIGLLAVGMIALNEAVFFRKAYKPFVKVAIICLILLPTYAAFRLNVSYQNDFSRRFTKVSTTLTEERIVANLRLSGILLQIPVIGTPLWYLLGPPLAVLIPRNWLEMYYTSGISYLFILGITTKIVTILLFGALIKGLFLKGELSKDVHELMAVIVMITLMVGFASEMAELRHMTMVYPFMFMLTALVFGKRWPSTVDGSYGRPNDARSGTFSAGTSQLR